MLGERVDLGPTKQEKELEHYLVSEGLGHHTLTGRYLAYSFAITRLTTHSLGGSVVSQVMCWDIS